MEILGTEMLMVRSKGGAVHRGEKDAMGTDWTFPSERVRCGSFQLLDDGIQFSGGVVSRRITLLMISTMLISLFVSS